jgi:hypothetical protein
VKVVITDAAIEDLQAIGNYIAERASRQLR